MPLTFVLGFIDRPLADVERGMLEWLRGLGVPVRSEAFSATLEAALTRLEPLSVLARRELLVETKSPWTAFFDSGLHGAEASPRLETMAERLGATAVIVECIPHTLRTHGQKRIGTYGTLSFELCDGTRTGFLNHCIRSVRVAHDGARWEFFQGGQSLSFEDTSAYARRRIRDRLTEDMLLKYLEAFGVRANEPEFYGSACRLFVRADPLPEGHRVYSLEDARSYWGLDAVE